MTSLYGPGQDGGASATPSGSRASMEPSGLHPSGFDPSRWMDLYCGLANARYALEFWEREYAVAARRGAPIPMALMEWCRERGRRECETLAELEQLVRPVACRDAIATEAGTAETVKQGSVHEGAGPQDIAQSQPLGNPLDTGDGK